MKIRGGLLKIAIKHWCTVDNHRNKTHCYLTSTRGMKGMYFVAFLDVAYSDWYLYMIQMSSDMEEDNCWTVPEIYHDGSLAVGFIYLSSPTRSRILCSFRQGLIGCREYWTIPSGSVAYFWSTENGPLVIFGHWNGPMTSLRASSSPCPLPTCCLVRAWNLSKMYD